MEKNDAKKRALDLAIAQIEKQFGKGSIMKLGQSGARLNVDVIPTGSLVLDIILGVGGIPRGRVTEIYGPEASAKTTLALQVVAEAQKMGGIAAFIDVEHALDPDYAKALGVDVENLFISQPDTGEQALEIVESLVRSNALDVIVIDSVAALVPRAEIEGEMSDQHVGLQARLMSKAMRKLTGVISKTKTACIFINQVREKIGVMFGNPETTPGGRALKFYSSLRIEIRRQDTIKKGGESLGTHVRTKIVKNKLAPPFKQASLTLIFGQGIHRESSILDAAVEHNIIKKSGSWYSYNDTKLGQGSENSAAFLATEPELCKEIVTKTILATGIPSLIKRLPEDVRKENNIGDDGLEIKETVEEAEEDEKPAKV